MIRDKIQKEAREVWSKTKKGTLVMGTGVGKSKIAIDIKESLGGKWLLVVPTQKLRDEGWKNEFEKWGYKFDLDRVCYASLKNVEQAYDGIILDEAHNITINNSEYFQKYSPKYVVGLTATYPDPTRDYDKYQTLLEIAPPVLTYTLEQGVKDGIIAPFDIKIIEVPLDSTDKYIHVKTKKYDFHTTEAKNYESIDSKIRKIMFSGKTPPKFMFMERMRFLYNLKSKEKIAKKIKETLKDKRVLLFTGSIEQADRICEYSYHSKSGDEGFNLFKEKKINHLSCVDALNEGHNLPEIDCGIMTKITSNPLTTIQRIGRLVRIREGHKATVYIVVSMGTQEQSWLKKAIASLPSYNIEYLSYRNYD